MRDSRSLRVVLALGVLVCVAGIVANARGASATPKVQAWGLTPGTVGSGALPRAGAAKKLVVDLQGVSATSIDNAPTGTSQGDQIAVAGSLLIDGKPAGTLSATETATQVIPDGNGFKGKLLVTGVCQLAGGQISIIAISGFSNPRPVKAAVIGGTGVYKDVRGQMFVSQGPNNTTRFTFYLTN